MNLFKKLSFVFLVVTSFGAYAQDAKKTLAANSPLVTDRPNATESPLTIPVGFFQYEGGFLYSNDKAGSNGSEKLVYNTSLFRLGLLDNLELRLGYNVLNEKREILKGAFSSREFYGIDPMLLGFKVAIRQGEEGKANLGVLGHVNLPFTASKDFRPETTAADFRFLVSHSLSKKSSLSYNIGAKWGADNPEIAYIYTLSYGVALSSKWSYYAEVYGDFPENSKANHLWDSGLVYLLSNAVQLDATIGSGINTNQTILLAAGLSVRLPK
jgi:hypothetical protein|tara:strand:+ start:835 stop:1641 length:807 start_codon:yes stop_codon:yes gene_type:complete